MDEFKPKQIARLFPSRWHRGYISTKLRSDPLYEAVHKELKASPLPLLDIGCGLGILAFYLREKGETFPVKAIDYDQRKITEANIAARHYPSLSFKHLDVRDGIPKFSGNVTVLDILQFFTSSEQLTLLKSAALSIAKGGKLIIRSGIRDNSMRFKITRLGDHLARASFWMKASPTCYPDINSIVQTMEEEGLSGKTRPLWGKTPFNNHLLVFSRD